MRNVVVILLLALILTGCAPAQSSPSSGSGGTPEATPNTDMNVAMQQAQQNLPAFIKALQSPKPNQSGFALKARFPYGAGSDVEILWVSHLSHASGAFQGTLDDKPTYVTSLHLGDPVTVQDKDVADWMLIQDKALYGGFTIIALRNRMSPSDKATFNSQFGVTVPEQPAIP